MNLPHIAIPSYLGDTKGMQERRFGYHLRQREVLESLWPTLRIVSFCSGWPAVFRKDFPYTSHHFKDRKRKWEVQAFVLKQLYTTYGGSTPTLLRAVLFLDDDVVPRPLRPGDSEAGLVHTHHLISTWLKYPDLMTAPLAFFCAAGLRFDAFWKSQPILAEAPKAGVMGWAMMFRNDLGVMPDEKMAVVERDGVTHTCDDWTMRVKAGAAGKLVVKHGRCFFKTLQGTGEKSGEKSVCFDSHAHRVETNRVFKDKLLKEYPAFFAPKRGAKKAGTGGFFK